MPTTTLSPGVSTNGPPLSVTSSTNSNAPGSTVKPTLTQFTSHASIKTTIDAILTADIAQTDLITHANNMYACLELLATNRDNDATNLQTAINLIIDAFHQSGITVPARTMSMLAKAGLGLGTIIAAPLVATAAAVGIGSSVVTAPMRLAADAARNAALRKVSPYLSALHSLVNETNLTDYHKGQIAYARTVETENPDSINDLFTLREINTDKGIQTQSSFNDGKKYMEDLADKEKAQPSKMRTHLKGSTYKNTNQANNSALGLGTRAYRYAKKRLWGEGGGYTRHNRNISLHSAARTRAYHYKPVRLV